jgi:two-component system sensor histidine kinase YesM
MAAGSPVVENEKILDEIRGVARLVEDILQDYIVMEIDSAAAQNEEIKQRAWTLGAVEIIILLLVSFFSLHVQFSVNRSVGKEIGALSELSGKIAEGDLDARAVKPALKEFSALTANLNTMAGNIKALMEDNIEEQRVARKSEMKALQAQITPHFLYNTLDSIIWLAEAGKYDDVVEITRALSAFFRISLNQGSEWVSVEEEFRHVESYLTIQKIRYHDILEYTIDCEDTIKDYQILNLLLQPLVENALYHGIKNKRGGGKIAVTGTKRDGALEFTVSDDGIGMDAEKLRGARNGAGIGLGNVRKRLELYYNRSGLLSIKSAPQEGTVVTLHIPIENTGEGDV